MKDIPILYDNADILVVNKPCGIAVQGGDGVTVTILDILERQSGSKIYPVHRLDKDTSGILVVARSSRAAADFSKHIAGKSLVKEYRAVCFGIPEGKKGTITVPAGRSGDEKPAETDWRVESSVKDAGGKTGCSLISLSLGTGRMHQIRMHLASIGCPIIADDKYGDFPQNRAIRLEFKVRKLQLCAWALTLPLGNSTKRFTISLPEHMFECISALGLTVPDQASD